MTAQTGTGRIDRSIRGFVAVLAIGFAVFGAYAQDEEAEPKPAVAPIELRLFETEVHVSAYVECNRYEGKVISCKTDPGHAFGDVVNARLIVGITAVEIDGHRYPTKGRPGTETEFIPEVDGKRLNVSGKKEMTVSVVYVE